MPPPPMCLIDVIQIDAQLFNEFHALWDRHAKEACAKTPRCQGCCLLDICPTGQSLMPDG